MNKPHIPRIQIRRHHPKKTGLTHIQVKLIPLGKRISYRVLAQMFCKKSGIPVKLQNKGILSKEDVMWKGVFKSRASMERFIGVGKEKIIVASQYDFGYSKCDYAVKVK